MSKNARGFIQYLVLSIAVIAIAATAIALTISHRDKTKAANTTASTSTSTSQTTDPYAGWKTYENQEGDFTFKYPPNWTNQATTMQPLSDGSFTGAYGNITSPSKHTLYWIYMVVGGKGDDVCTPASSDAPFTPGNKCATKQIITVEPLPAAKQPVEVGRSRRMKIERWD